MVDLPRRLAWNDYWLVLTYALYMLARACSLPDSRALFVFDGVCVVCSGGASWIMRFDRRPKVNFTSMQGRWAGRSIAITASSRTRATC